jgi:hypothetical protein
VCSNVGTAITANTTLTGETMVGYSSHYGTGTVDTGCTFLGGPDRVYAVTVPANSRLTATGSSATANLILNVVDGPASACMANPVVCAASADNTGTGGSEVVRFDNATASAKTVLLIVDRYTATLANDTFDLTIGLGALPPVVAGGETCAAPAVISNNTTIYSTTVGMMNDLAFVDTGKCQGATSATSVAPDAVFQTTIPANSSLTVATTGSWDRTLNVVAAPAANCGTGMGTGIVCLAGSDVSPETVTVENPTGAPITVLILIDGWSTGSGSFEMTTSTAPIVNYTKTIITSACQDMTAGTALAGTIGDDVTSLVTPLPSGFAFTFYGVPMTHFSASSNGFAQLWSSSTANPSSANSNSTIPTNSTPNSLLAVFWDDLIDVTGSSVKTLVTGTAPNRRFTIEWADFSFYDAAGGPKLERLTFQAQLVETSNVVEFHYCKLAANGSAAPTLPTGAKATVGIENHTGSGGSLHLFDGLDGAMPGVATTVTTTNGLRFTP